MQAAASAVRASKQRNRGRRIPNDCIPERNSIQRELRLSFYNDSLAASTAQLARRFSKEDVLARLRDLEKRVRLSGLKALDPRSDPLVSIGCETDPQGRVTKNSYGVFDLAWQAQNHAEWPARIASELQRIRADIAAAHGAKIRYLIWAGMGGSIEDKSMYNAAGLLAGGPRFYALDSTDPAKLRYILEDMRRRSNLTLPDVLRSTLVAGMAMGMTSYEPVVNLEKLAALYRKYGIDSRPNFLYLTLPGSLLDRFAGAQGYRSVPLQLDDRNTTAGRHSGPLTRGSLYPLGLAGIDMQAWIAGAFLTRAEIETAWTLSAFLHAHGAAGRDKVTLLLPKSWSGAALWTKQDFEESLGKREDIGIKIAIGEKVKAANYRSPEDPRQDRVFLVIGHAGSAEAGREKISGLRRAGYPAAVVDLQAQAPLSHYMQFMHYVVFGIGYLRKMNFVTQPAVELYKSIANELYAAARKSTGIQRSKAWAAMLKGANPAPKEYAGLLQQLAGSREVEYGELTFFGDTRYSPQGRRMRKCLDGAGERVFRSRLKMPVDIYEGPAMNHSYHEMIIGRGKCFSTILLSEKQEHYPAAKYEPDYHIAQFLATRMALERKGRRVVALLVKDTSAASIARLDRFFRETAALLK